MDKELCRVGYQPALYSGRPQATHVDGKQLDQVWTLNLTISNAVVGGYQREVSDHAPIHIKLQTRVDMSK